MYVSVLLEMGELSLYESLSDSQIGTAMANVLET